MPVTTYHCLCTELVLASTVSLASLHKRARDGAFICPLTSHSGIVDGSATLTESSLVEPEPILLKLEDGFEKRYLVKCSRCGLMLGYHLDTSQFDATKSSMGVRGDVLYILPGGLHTTTEMTESKQGTTSS